MVRAYLSCELVVLSRHTATLAWLLLLFLPITGAAQFLPPGVLNPGADTDTGDDSEVDQVIDANGVIHAVWASDVDYTGSAGTDIDLFYARLEGGVWSTPELVNSYGTSDGAVSEREPRIAWSGGVVHVVWASAFPFAGSGTDDDIFYARRSGGTWSLAQLVNTAFGDITHETSPTVAVRSNGDVLVLWQGSDPGSDLDRDIWWGLRAVGSTTWTTPLTVDGNALFDSGDDWGPVGLGPTPDGDVVAVWSTDDPFTPQVGSDRDVVQARLPAPPAGTWSSPIEVSAQARGDTAVDRDPVVAVIGSGLREEVHVAWRSDDSAGGAGPDFDILHTVIREGAVTPPMNPAWVANSSGLGDPGNSHDAHPSLCFEPGGVLHLVWQGTDPVVGDMEVYHSTNATSGSDWSPLELLGLNGLFDQPGEQDIRPRIACAPNGVLSGMWSSTDNLGGAVGSDQDIFHALGVGRLVSRPAFVNQHAPFDAGSDEEVALAVDSQDVLHAVWWSAQSTIGGTWIGTDHDILYASKDTAGWSAPEIVNTNADFDTNQDQSPQIVIDAQDRIHVVWKSNENIGGQAGVDLDLFYSVKVGLSWSAPQLANSSGTSDTRDDRDGRLAIAPDGTVHLVWIGGSDLRFARRTASGWSSEEVIYSGSVGVTLIRPEILVTADGVPHVVWASDDPAGSAGTDLDIFYARRSGGSWSTPQFVNNATNDAAADLDAAIAAAPDGGLHVVWESDLQLAGAGSDIDLFYSKRSGTTWTSPQLLLALGSSDVGRDSSPSVVIDSQSVLHVAWETNEPLLFSAAGTDEDIFYAAVPLSATLPTDVPVSLANASGWADAASDRGVDLLLDRREKVHFAWSSSAQMGGTVASDRDVFHAFLPGSGSRAGSVIFSDGFESGSTSAWTLVQP